MASLADPRFWRIREFGQFRGLRHSGEFGEFGQFGEFGGYGEFGKFGEFGGFGAFGAFGELGAFGGFGEFGEFGGKSRRTRRLGPILAAYNFPECPEYPERPEFSVWIPCFAKHIARALCSSQKPRKRSYDSCEFHKPNTSTGGSEYLRDKSTDLKVEIATITECAASYETHDIR